MPAKMTVTFTKVRGAPAVHRWPGTPGLVATSLVWNAGLPHDLMHWLMEAQVDLPWGFWSLAGQQAPFESLTLVEGRWPKGRQEWLDRVRRKHGYAMLHAEAQDGSWLAHPDLDVHAAWPEIRARLAKTYAFSDSPLARFGPQDVEALRPFALRAAAAWEALPAGGSLEVHWPGANDLVVVDSAERGAFSLRGRHAIPAMYHGRDENGQPTSVAMPSSRTRRPVKQRKRAG